MKKRLFLKATMLVIATLFFSVPAAMGYQVSVVRTSGYYEGNGGEFTVTPLGDFSYILTSYTMWSIYNGGFQTFCIEKDEYVSPDGTVYNAGIQESAEGGGVNIVEENGSDPVSLGTAWLYNEFVLGNLSGYDYTPGDPSATVVNHRELSAYDLQTAIWHLEGEITLADPSSNYFLNLLVSEGVAPSIDAAMNDNNSLYPVYALHLTTLSGGAAQDLLVRSVSVPEPSTLLLLGATLISLVGMRRRMLLK
jgi:hypothetical protein